MQARRPLEIWLSKSKKRRVEHARNIGCSPSHLTLVAQGLRGASLDLALKIVRETRGAVKVSQLLKDKNEARAS